jgi:ABC-2 type transport system ATP-binding protein
MIKINNYSKSYDGKNYIIDNMNLNIEKGDLYGFIGHNGAGKTTTIKSIVGILEFEKGDILIDGTSIKKRPIECKKIMAYVPDNPEIYENLTGLQYIYLICDLYGVDKDKRLPLIEKYCKELELEGVLNDLVGSYSHGMKQKLVLIASLVHEPKVLVLDEPFVGLDPKASFNLKKIMNEFCSNGGSIFFSTHVLEVAQKICNKIAIIKNGQIILEGKTEELTKTQSLEEIFMEQANE